MKRRVHAAELVWALQYRHDVAKYTSHIYYCVTKFTRLIYDVGSQGLTDLAIGPLLFHNGPP